MHGFRKELDKQARTASASIFRGASATVICPVRLADKLALLFACHMLAVAGEWHQLDARQYMYNTSVNKQY